jgi:hypothetical protein
LEPKQSSSLRGASFKRLNDLKTNGFFGKEIVVRKTMFDECKGPKFEELLAVFSTAVLLRAIENTKEDRSVVKRELLKSTISSDLSIFALTYKASLSNNILNREAVGRRWNKFGRLLASKGGELDQRVAQIDKLVLANQQKRIPRRTLDRLQKHLRTHWVGDPQWVEIILRSDQHLPSNNLLERSFDDIWKHACNDTLYTVRPEKTESLLHTLERRVEEQQTRLDKWKAIRNSLPARKPVPPPEEQVAVEPPRLERKYSLRSGAGVARSVSVRETPRPRTISQPRREVEPTLQLQRKGHRRAKSEATDNTILTTPTVTPGISRPLANTSARLAAPQNFKSRTSYSKGPRYSTVQEEFIEPEPILTPSREEFAEQSEILDQTYNFDPTGSEADDIVSAILNADPSPSKPLLSLAERTRLSMAAIATPQKQENIPPPSITTLATMNPEYTRFTAFTSNSGNPDILSDLAERTRQSMSAMSLENNNKPKENRRVSSKPPRPSIVYPVNQFETPRKNITPQEMSFFDETNMDLDEASIFKSRPRVALSPMLTPMAEGRESIGNLNEVLHDGDGDDDVSYEDDFS